MSLELTRPGSRSFGWVRDVHDVRDWSLDRLAGANISGSGAAVSAATMAVFRVGELRQGRAGSCVATALDRCVDMCLRRTLFQQGSTVQPPKLSRRFVYANARVGSNFLAGNARTAITDSGCMPRVAMSTIQTQGYPTEDLFPYTDDPLAINEIPSPEVYRAAFDQIGLEFARIDSVGDQKVADVAAALNAGFPVLFGMTVDPAFMEWKGGAPIDVVDLRDPADGGHMLSCYRVDTDGNPWFDNWWLDDEPPTSPPSWGTVDPTDSSIRGVGCLSKAQFGSSNVGDVYAIRAVMKFSSDLPESTR